MAPCMRGTTSRLWAINHHSAPASPSRHPVRLSQGRLLGGRGQRQPARQLLRQPLKHVRHVGAAQRAGLQEQVARAVGQVAPLLLLDRALRAQVALVTNQHHHHVGGRVRGQLRRPVADLVERLAACDVVHHGRRLRAPVVQRGERLVALLARGVPDLVAQAQPRGQGGGARQERGADGGRGGGEHALGEPQRQARLAHARGPQHDQLDARGQPLRQRAAAVTQPADLRRRADGRRGGRGPACA
mmetsp:Transcript_24890/g.63138  ORF Transcript_24890/g.63138 Transcript_24890/m.63138 type:complete len:244 (-) Transcript_24890:300-1031(-)